MPDVFLYQGNASPNDVTLSDPTVLRGGNPPATIQSLGIASAEVIGSEVIQARIAAVGIPSAEVLGSETIQSKIVSVGLATGEAVGSQSVKTTIAAAGIPTAEAIGSEIIKATIASSGIPTAEAIGAEAVVAKIAASGIASAEAIGQPGLSARIEGAGIPSAQALGAPEISTEDITPTEVTIYSAGIPSDEAIGAPAISAVRLIIIGGGGDFAFGWHWPLAKQEDATIQLKQIESSAQLGRPTIMAQLKLESPGTATVDDLLGSPKLDWDESAEDLALMLVLIEN